MQSMQFFGKVITPNGISPHSKFLFNLVVPKSTKQVERQVFLQFFKCNIRILREELMTFFKLLCMGSKWMRRHALQKLGNSLKLSLNPTNLTVSLHNQVLHSVFFDASYFSAGFVLMIKYYIDQKITAKNVHACFFPIAALTTVLSYLLCHWAICTLYLGGTEANCLSDRQQNLLSVRNFLDRRFGIFWIVFFIRYS